MSTNSDSVLVTPDGHGLGRLVSPDPRDAEYPVLRLAARRLTPLQQRVLERGYRYWHSGEPFLEQGDVPACVGFSWAQWVLAGPVTSWEINDADGHRFYRLAQDHDEWPGNAYEGSSVRGGAKALRELGYIVEFRWASNAEEAARSILLDGPMVVGFDWFDGMHRPEFDKRLGAVMSRTGRNLGGHAFLLTGVNMKLRMFRVKNSWGRRWADEGRAWLPFETFDALMPNWGEACIALEKKLTA